MPDSRTPPGRGHAISNRAARGNEVFSRLIQPNTGRTIRRKARPTPISSQPMSQQPSAYGSAEDQEDENHQDALDLFGEFRHGRMELSAHITLRSVMAAMVMNPFPPTASVRP